jgi:beta-N-acetylhexosaminidase
MQIIKRIGVILIWFAGLLFVFAAVNKNDPYLIALRGAGNIVLFVASIATLAILIRRGYWRRRGIAGKMLVLLWCLPPLSMVCAHGAFEWRKRNVLQAEATQAHSLGQHFIVGYSSFPEVAVLAEKSLIAGICITKHNVLGTNAEMLKSEISALQDRRRAADLPPLIVAADQEGGIVSHLSPPLTKFPSLSSVAGLAPEVRAEKAEAFGRIHGGGNWRRSASTSIWRRCLICGRNRSATDSISTR